MNDYREIMGGSDPPLGLKALLLPFPGPYVPVIIKTYLAYRAAPFVSYHPLKHFGVEFIDIVGMKTDRRKDALILSCKL